MARPPVGLVAPPAVRRRRASRARGVAAALVGVVAATSACSGSGSEAHRSDPSAASPLAVQGDHLVWVTQATERDPVRVLDAATAALRLGGSADTFASGPVAAALREASSPGSQDVDLLTAAAQLLGARDGGSVPAELMTALRAVPAPPAESLLRYETLVPAEQWDCAEVGDAVGRADVVSAGALGAPAPPGACAGAVSADDWDAMLEGVHLDAAAESAAQARFLPHLAEVLSLDIGSVSEQAVDVVERLSSSGGGLPVHVSVQQALDLSSLVAGAPVDAEPVVAGLQQVVRARGGDADEQYTDAIGTYFLLEHVRRHPPLQDSWRTVADQDSSGWLWNGGTPLGDEATTPLLEVVERNGSPSCGSDAVRSVRSDMDSAVTQSQGTPTPVALTLVARQAEVLRGCGAPVPDLPFETWEGQLSSFAGDADADDRAVLLWAVAESHCLRTGEVGDVPRLVGEDVDDIAAVYAVDRLVELREGCTAGWWGPPPGAATS